MSTQNYDWAVLNQNPHCMEIVQNRPTMPFFVDPPFSRTLDDDAEEMMYQSTKDKIRTRVHWGQRKLLMSEIEFLTILKRQNLENALVVYAGAAPGTHIPYLCDLFPEIKFLLVDPAPFKVKTSGQVQIIQDIFTDELASEIARQNTGKSIYFVSDIRTADPDTDKAAEIERKVQSDQDSQMEWHKLLGAKRSMLKFRLPWEIDSTEYLDGDIYLPVWGPQMTTECRLITYEHSPLQTKVYDNKKYESQMMFFNNVTRHSLFQHNVVGEGLDHCYDCMAEIHILKAYLREYPEHRHGDGLYKTIANMSRDISRLITKNRTLLDPTPDNEVRKAGIKRTQYRGARPAHEEAYARNRRVRDKDTGLHEDTLSWQLNPQTGTPFSFFN